MTIVNLLLAAATVYLAVVSGLYLGQTWLIFPSGLASGTVPLPASAERIEAESADGHRLVGTRIPPAVPTDDPPLLIAFGGNAWNADHLARYVHEALPSAEVVAFHFRGYGPSEGRPGAQALLADAPLVHDAAIGDEERRVVAVGFSIGAALAVRVARERKIAGMILVTPFDSLESLVRETYFWAPVGLLLRHHFTPIEEIGEIRVPAAVVTAERDSIVPERRTAPLREAIPELVYDRAIEGAGHNDLYGRSAFVDSLGEALDAVLQSGASSAGIGRIGND
jgi:uncharacterized protein